MSDFVNPASLTYVFMDVSRYNSSERDYAKETWARLAAEHGAEKIANPETVVKHEINYDLPFQGIRISQKTDLAGLVAAFRDSRDAATFAQKAHDAFDSINYSGADIVVSRNNVGFMPYTGPGYH